METKSFNLSKPRANKCESLKLCAFSFWAESTRAILKIKQGFAADYRNMYSVFATNALDIGVVQYKNFHVCVQTAHMHGGLYHFCMAFSVPTCS